MHVCMSEASFTEVCLINISGLWLWKLRNPRVIMKVMQSPEVNLSTVNISISINTLHAILVHFVPTSVSVIRTEYDAWPWKEVDVCVCVWCVHACVCVCMSVFRWRKLIHMLALTYSRGFRGNRGLDLTSTLYNLSITAVWWTHSSNYHIFESIS